MKKKLRKLSDAKLASSGLNGSDYRALRIDVLSAEQLRAKCAVLPAYTAALVLPYFDLQGAQTDFWRARYLEDTRSGWSAVTKTKPLRYVQPPDTLNELYLPPYIKWAKVAENQDAPVVITEGELKSAIACKLGIPTIGLGGVWMFKAARRKLPLLPQFYQFKWANRKVYITFDSDARTNPQVQRATAELSRELAALGAIPYIVDIPALPEITKTGLDDFFVANGLDPKPFAKLLERAEPYAPSAALYELNAEVAYIRDPGLVVVLSDGRKMSAGAFREHAYANRYYYEERTNAKGTTSLVRVPAAPAWIGWERRAELSRITYEPGAERITTERAYNYWSGWGAEPVKGSVTLWNQLLDYLFDDEPEARAWYERWCAYPLQHPGAKLYSAAVLWGVEQGTGKTLAGYTLMRIYGRNATEIDDEQLSASHNEWAENKQFVLADDITSADKRAARGLADRLKGMITRRELRLNPKYIPSYTVPDCINYQFTANHPDAFFLEDTDRRYFIHEVKGKPLSRDFYRQYDRWYLSEEGINALFYHLLHLPLKDFDPGGPAMPTTAKSEMLEASLSDVGVWVRKLRDTPDAVLRIGDVALEGDLFTNTELLALYDPEGKHKVLANGLGREMSRAGILRACKGKPARLPDGTQSRLYAVRNAQFWARASQTAAGEHYAQRHGQTPPPSSKHHKFKQ